MSKNKSNSNLHKALKDKNDEFYTQLSDIVKELSFYKNNFKNKIVLCNCDDPSWSNFYRYFEDNFIELGLKKLIATCFNIDKKVSEIVELELKNSIVVKNKKEVKGNGDFRNEESQELWKQADIIVTNPPFSLFREFLSHIIKYDKKFIIIGSKNAITYKETFKLIKQNKIWIGVSSPKSFLQPDGNIKKFGNIGWYTNLTHKVRNQNLILTQEYNNEDYKTYDNYNAIEVSRVVKIPKNYKGVMGVPITFLEKYNPDQFTILGMASSAGYNAEVVGIPFLGSKDARPLLDGQNTFARIFIQNK